MTNSFEELLYKKAAKLYPDIEERSAFLEGFAKQAAQGEPYSFDDHLNKGIGEGIGRAIAGGLGGTAIMAIAGMASSVNRMRLHADYLKALNEAIRENRVLKGANRNKVISFGETIFKFAPHVATDAHLLATVLANAIHGEGIDPMTIRTLTELENKYQETRSIAPKALTS